MKKKALGPARSRNTLRLLATSRGVAAIIVLCGGLDKKGVPHPWVIERLNKALDLRAGSEPIILAGRGTPYKSPPRDKNGFPIDECVASAKYLVSHGFSPRKIIPENISMDTIGNAYFTRFLIAEPMRLRKILVITSAFHMPRVKEIFKWVYGLRQLPVKYELKFQESSNKGLASALAKLKSAREMKKLTKLRPLMNKIKTVWQMHEFIFFKHGVYSYGKKIQKPKGKIVRTY